MKLRHWNGLSALGIILMIAGLLLSKVSINAGRGILIVGCIVFGFAIIGSTRHSKKNPIRCPRCGVELIPVGRRYRGGIHHIDALDTIPCPKCGALVSSSDYTKEN